MPHLIAALGGVPFWVGSRLRGARVFHPRGLTLAGHLTMTGDGPLPTGGVDCVVRVSKALGTPPGTPDILGVAFRVEGPEPIDVLAATCGGTHGVRRLLLWPVARWHGARLSSLMPWESDDGRRGQALLEVDDARLTSPEVEELLPHLPVSIGVRVADTRRVLQSGELVVTGPPLADVAFDPVLQHPAGWRLVPEWLAAWRVSAYAASRSARSAPWRRAGRTP